MSTRLRLPGQRNNLFISLQPAVKFQSSHIVKQIMALSPGLCWAGEKHGKWKQEPPALARPPGDGSIHGTAAPPSDRRAGSPTPTDCTWGHSVELYLSPELAGCRYPALAACHPLSLYPRALYLRNSCYRETVQVELRALVTAQLPSLVRGRSGNDV